jgi:uncharacterized protein
MRFADTNIFLAYLVKPVSESDQQKSDACRALFQRVIAGEEEITTSESVLAEIVYVLGSPRQYRLPPQDIVSRLKPIIALSGLKIANKRTYLRALDIFAAHPQLDFEDAVSTAIVERMNPAELYSYDRDFDRVDEVTRIEPVVQA